MFCGITRSDSFTLTEGGASSECVQTLRLHIAPGIGVSKPARSTRSNDSITGFSSATVNFDFPYHN